MGSPMRWNGNDHQRLPAGGMAPADVALLLSGWFSPSSRAASIKAVAGPCF